MLRIHPAVLETVRVPMQDDVLPLSKPIVGTSGRVYTELPVPKGTHITVSATGYNLYIFPAKSLLPWRSTHTIVLVTGTKICGVQMLMNSDRSVGSKQMSI